MAKTLNQLIGYQTMLGVVESIRDGIPVGKLPPALLAQTEPCEGHLGSYFKVDGTRETARIVAYGSPAVRANTNGVTETPVTLLHSYEFIDHKPAVLSQLVDMNNPARQAKGEAEIDRQTSLFLSRFRNLRIAAVMSAISQGKIWADSSGNLLSTSSGAAVTVDYGIPAGNQNQLDVFGAGAIISATWATTSTKIVEQLQAIQIAAAKKTGYALKYAIYGSNIPYYLAANDTFKQVIQGNAAAAADYQKGLIPADTAGLQWIPGGDMFYVDATGTLRSWVGADQIIFLPEIDPTWYGLLEGTYPIPQDLGSVSETAVQQLANIVEAQGFFSYCKLNDNPVTVRQFGGDTFLPVIKVPGAVFIADVTP
jgi:hypothetical protein